MEYSDLPQGHPRIYAKSSSIEEYEAGVVGGDQNLGEYMNKDEFRQKWGHKEKSVTLSARMAIEQSGHRQFSWINLLIVLGISLSSLSFGYSAAVIGTITGQPTFLEYFNLVNSSNGADLLGACVCMYYVGGVFGSIYAGWASDRWGRRNSQIQAAIIVAISGALQAGSVHVAMFIVGRFLSGIA